MSMLMLAALSGASALEHFPQGGCSSSLAATPLFVILVPASCSSLLGGGWGMARHLPALLRFLPPARAP